MAPKSHRLRNGLIIAVGAVAGFLVMAFVALNVYGKAYRIPSEAMAPTLELGDRIIVKHRGSYDPKRGDIVVFNPPGGADINRCGDGSGDTGRRACARPAPGELDQTFVKRIVALGGDRLKVIGGRVHVDGRPLNEPYARLDAGCDICNLPEEIRVPPGHVFMMGDNRGASADSRVWGPVREDSIVGPVIWRYWPLSGMGKPD